MMVPASAAAEGWSGTVSLDYASENFDQFTGTVGLSDSDYLGGPTRSTPPDPDFDGAYSWRMYGAVTGAYAQSFNACQIDAAPDPRFEKRPKGVGGNYTYNQGLLMFGPARPAHGGGYILNHMGLHLTGTQDCGGQVTPFEDTGVPFPDLEQDAQGRPIHPLNLRLPLAGERGPDRLKGGVLRWRGTQSLSHQSFDPDGNGPATGLKTAVWDYDLRYRPFDPAGCSLRARKTQHLLDGFVAFRVVANKGGCTAKLTAAKVKIGKKGGGRLTAKKPKAKVAHGNEWLLTIPYRQKRAQQVFDALRAGKKVWAKASFTLNGKKASVRSKIV